MRLFNATLFLVNHIIRRTYCIPPPRTMSKIVWMDMEMSGLNVEKERILEIACLITNNNLDILAECPTIILHQSEKVLKDMDEWNTSTHAKSGLTDQVQKSTTTESQAEEILLDFFIKNGVEKSTCPLAGNTIYMDRMFIRSYLPRVDEHIHYRIIDVSSVKELCKRWNPKIFSAVPKKLLAHRGLSDIRESVNELKYYKQFMFAK